MEARHDEHYHVDFSIRRANIGLDKDVRKNRPSIVSVDVQSLITPTLHIIPHNTSIHSVKLMSLLICSLIMLI